MAEAKANPKTTVRAGTTDAPDPPQPTRTLARASESGDPAVHHLLAELQTARANGNAAEVERLTGDLADLGFE